MRSQHCSTTLQWPHSQTVRSLSGWGWRRGVAGYQDSLLGVVQTEVKNELMRKSGKTLWPRRCFKLNFYPTPGGRENFCWKRRPLLVLIWAWAGLGLISKAQPAVPVVELALQKACSYLWLSGLFSLYIWELLKDSKCTIDRARSGLNPPMLCAWRMRQKCEHPAISWALS